MTAKLHDHLSYPPRAMRAERAAAYLSISRLIYLQFDKNAHYVELLLHQWGREPFLPICSGG